MNRDMKSAPAPALVVAAVVVGAGCAGSHKPEVKRTILPERPVARDIRVARASNAKLFAIFPAVPGARRCRIPAIAGVSATTLHGTCHTTIAYPTTHGRHREAFVVFREDWGRRQTSWIVIVQLPAAKVVATQVSGAPAPQYRYATDRVARAAQLLAGEVQVVAYPHGDVRICPPYALALDSGPMRPPNCRDGLRAVGVDVNELTDHAKKPLESWGYVYLVGVFRHGTFWVTSQRRQALRSSAPTGSSFSTPPCGPPHGGWRLVAPTIAQRDAIGEYGRHHRGELVSIAFFHDATILTVASTRPERTRALLGRAWPDQLCVVRAHYSRPLVYQVRARLIRLLKLPAHATYGWITGAGGDGVTRLGQPTVSIDVLIETPQLRLFLRRLPRGLVAVDSTLRPFRTR
jgi:hypothetical protein